MHDSSQRFYRTKKNSMIAGVCAGLSEYWQVDPVWVRLAWLLFALATAGLACMAYLLLWWILPEDGSVPVTVITPPRKLLMRDWGRRKLAGVCSGIAQYWDKDPVMIRVIFILSAIFSLGFCVFIYLALWCLMPVGPE